MIKKCSYKVSWACNHSSIAGKVSESFAIQCFHYVNCIRVIEIICVCGNTNSLCKWIASIWNRYALICSEFDILSFIFRRRMADCWKELWKPYLTLHTESAGVFGEVMISQHLTIVQTTDFNPNLMFLKAPQFNSEQLVWASVLHIKLMRSASKTKRMAFDIPFCWHAWCIVFARDCADWKADDQSQIMYVVVILKCCFTANLYSAKHTAAQNAHNIMLKSI